MVQDTYGVGGRKVELVYLYYSVFTIDVYSVLLVYMQEDVMKYFVSTVLRSSLIRSMVWCSMLHVSETSRPLNIRNM